jgi:hypothetical protein
VDGGLAKNIPDLVLGEQELRQWAGDGGNSSGQATTGESGGAFPGGEPPNGSAAVQKARAASRKVAALEQELAAIKAEKNTLQTKLTAFLGSSVEGSDSSGNLVNHCLNCVRASYFLG